MNGMGTRRDYGMEAPSAFDDVRPTGRAMVDGYHDEIMNGTETQPLFNPLNVHRPQSSPLVDLQDPIQVHLLTETALADSREWVILSQEEVDDLKKQCQSLAQRIAQTRANLAIQSKYRDAAISMTKLYSPAKRRSLLGHRLSGGSNGSGVGPGSEAEREAEAERVACERRCEALASELFGLERRIMEPQRRLLQHTAGILQLTHRGGGSGKKSGTPANGQAMHDIPGSPESMYTINNGRESLELAGSPEGVLDERGLYLPINLEYSQRNSIAIPQKSPIRKETRELRDETNRLQTECEQLRAAHEALQRDVARAEHQLEDANHKLREVVVRFDPAANGTYREPPRASDEVGATILDQLQYLDDTLAAAEGEQQSRGTSVQAAAVDSSALAALEGSIAEANSALQQILMTYGGIDVDLVPVPMTSAGTEAGMQQQLAWLQGTLPSIEKIGQRAEAAAEAQKAEGVLQGLWDTMQKGFVDAQRRRAERKASRKQMGLGDDEEEMSGDEWGAAERYTLDAFAEKMQWLYRETTKLREHKAVLKRQIKQQRELNNKNESEKDQELRDKAAEVEQARQVADEAQSQLARALADLSDVQDRLMKKDMAAASGAESTQTQLAERSKATAALEAQLADAQGKLASTSGEVVSLQAKLGEANERAARAEQAAQTASAEAAAKDAELGELNAMVIELKTEATIAKAELEGAYGSRAQRAADVAALAKSSENTELQDQLDQLRSELAGTLREYEDLTKDSLAAERTRHDLEAQLDEALAARTALEQEVDAVRAKLEAENTTLREQLDAEKLRLPGGAGGASRGATMLSEQFRATMKEERKRFQEEMRTEQSQRRKLEEELRTLRRTAGAAVGAGPGKSPLSPR